VWANDYTDFDQCICTGNYKDIHESIRYYNEWSDDAALSAAWHVLTAVIALAIIRKVLGGMKNEIQYDCV